MDELNDIQAKRNVCMNIIDIINTKEEALSLRNHIAKCLTSDLSLNLKQRKLDELVAHIMGAKNWNTVLGSFEPAKQAPNIFPTIDINCCDIIELVNAHSQEPEFITQLMANLAEIDEDEGFDLQTLTFMQSCDHNDMIFHVYHKVDPSVIVRMLVEKMGMAREQFEARDYLKHFEYMSKAQHDEAIAVIMDSQYQPEGLTLLSLAHDSALRQSYMAYCEMAASYLTLKNMTDRGILKATARAIELSKK